MTALQHSVSAERLCFAIDRREPAPKIGECLIASAFKLGSGDA
jgi:hypothetical protein